MDKLDGGFGNGFLSLQLQLNTLFEEVGGERAIGLLDALGRLSSAEQKLLIPLLTKVVIRIASGEIRFFSQEDKEHKVFEEKLFQEILDDLKKAALKESGSLPDNTKRVFKIVEGGKGF